MVFLLCTEKLPKQHILSQNSSRIDKHPDFCKALCSTITLPLSSAMKTKGHVLHVFGDYFKCHSIDRICSNTALVRVRSLIIATVSLFGLSVEKSEKDNLLCTSQMMNATSLIFSKTYMALEEKF